MRTTLDIDKPVLDELKKLQKVVKKPLGQVASALLAEALAAHRFKTESRPVRALQWHSSSMGARIDLGDKDAVYRTLDRS